MTDPEQVLLRQAQSVYHRAGPGDLDGSNLYRSAQTYRLQALRVYLAAEQPGYWGLLSSVQLDGLCRELGQTLYTDCRAIADWLAATYEVRYSVSGLTDLLHRLGANAFIALSYRLTTAGSCLADTAKQTIFLTDMLAPLLAQAEAGEAVVYFADTAHSTHNTHATHVWTHTGKERPLLPVSARERVNLNAALNAHCPSQVHLDETDCVNVQSTQRPYEQLPAVHPEGSAYVICDNARYYKNKALNTWLAKKRLVQVFLPAYSPNLNLIERR